MTQVYARVMITSTVTVTNLGNQVWRADIMVTVPRGSSPATYHGGWRWLRLSARLCKSMSDCERRAGGL